MASDADDTALRRGLAGYVHAVAAVLRVPPEGTGFEISDTVTAYLGLAVRCPEYPGQDLMLAWGEQSGWVLAVETDPAEPPLVLAYLEGEDLVPEPRAVARFVADVVDGRVLVGARPVVSVGAGRAELARRLIDYA